MNSSRRQLAGKSPEEVAEFMANVTPGSPNDQMAKAEFALLQTNFQKETAQAAIDTAAHTRRYTSYMFWSVIVLAFSSIASFVLSVLTYFKN